MAEVTTSRGDGGAKQLAQAKPKSSQTIAARAESSVAVELSGHT